MKSQPPLGHPIPPSCSSYTTSALQSGFSQSAKSSGYKFYPRTPLLKLRSSLSGQFLAIKIFSCELLTNKKRKSALLELCFTFSFSNFNSSFQFGFGCFKFLNFCVCMNNLVNEALDYICNKLKTFTKFICKLVLN